MDLPTIDTKYLLSTLATILNTPSPTGYTEEAVNVVQDMLEKYPALTFSRTRKGALIVKWSGTEQTLPRAMTAHVDTLGAMVREVKSNGRLKLTKLGGYAWNTVEGEGCTVITAGGERVRGSILLSKASAHVHGSQVNDLKREDENMEVRLDIRSSSAEDTRKAGIDVGNFVAFDPRAEITNDFVRSRHLDDKACVACLIAAIQAMMAAGVEPVQDAYFYFSNYEEVGHGAAAGISPEVGELVVVDMAAVGEGQASDEYHATLCYKDSGGPYHYGLSQRLRQLAEDNQIAYKVDTYPYYASDGEAYWKAGGDVAVALIGPGVDASHNYERTHLDALVATTQWAIAYLLN